MLLESLQNAIGNAKEDDGDDDGGGEHDGAYVAKESQVDDVESERSREAIENGEGDGEDCHVGGHPEFYYLLFYFAP